jgi:two-component system LytT family response regulator
MPIRVLIVDDEPLAREKLVALLAREDDIEIVGEASDGASAVALIRRETPDLVFLDVQMPELDGFGVLQKIPADVMPAVIFVTAHDRFALRAFDVHAVDYLLKPFDRARLRQALERSRRELRHRGSGQPDPNLAGLLAAWVKPGTGLERIAVKSSGRIVLVRTEEIDWIEAADNYVQLHVGKTGHLHRETLSSLEQRLPKNKFIRISRSVMVNVDRVRELQALFHGDYAVILRDGTKLSLSRSYRARVEPLLGEGG